ASNSALFGAAGALAFTTAIKVGGKVFHVVGEAVSARRASGQLAEGVHLTGDATSVAEHAASRPASSDRAPGAAAPDHNLVASEGDYGVVRSTDAPLPQGEGIHVSADEVGTRYKEVGDSNYYVDPEQHVYLRNDSGVLVLDPDA